MKPGTKIKATYSATTYVLEKITQERGIKKMETIYHFHGEGEHTRFRMDAITFQQQIEKGIFEILT